MSKGSRIGLCVIAILALALSAAVHAGDADWLDMERPFVASTEAIAFAEAVSLSDPAIGAALRREQAAAAAEYQALLDQFAQRLGQDGGQDAYGRVLPDWRTALLRIEQAYDQKIRIALTEAQRTRWEFAARRFAIRQIVGQFRASSVTLKAPDLFELLETARIEVPDSGGTFDATNVQSARLAESLATIRNRYPALRQAMVSPASDPAEAMKDHEWLMASFAVYARDAYDAAHAIATTLAPEEHQRLEQAILCDRYPTLCAPTPCQLAFQTLEGIEMLDAAQRAQVVQAHRQYDADLAQLRISFAQFQDGWDQPAAVAARQKEYQALQQAGRNPNEAWRNHPGLPVLRKIAALEPQTAAKVRAIFTDEQWNRLPPRVQLAFAWPREK